MRTRDHARALSAVAVLVGVLAVGFQHLIRSPGSLIVDGRRPSVDRAYRGRVREVGNDLTSVFLPRFEYIVGQTRANGRPPRWDALGFGGRPLVGNPQAGVFYPPVWLAWRVGDPAALGWLTLAHLAWAGVGVYVLARALGLGRTAGVVAGACFELSPYLMAHTFEGHYPHVWAACWYPWAFWAMALCLRRSPAGYWALPGVLAAAFLAGHPQEWYYLVVVLAAGGAWEGAQVWRTEGPRAGSVRLATGAGLLAASFALCAVDLIPQAEAGVWSLKSGAGPSSQLNLYRLHTTNLLQLVSPLSLGGPHDYRGEDNYWEALCSIGFVPLILAVVGATGRAPRRVSRFWTALVLIALTFAAGKQLGLYSVAHAVLPGMGRFRVPARTLFLASLGAAVLAGAGVERLQSIFDEGPDWRRLRRRLTAAVAATALVVLAAVEATALALPLSGTRAVVGLSAAGAAPAFWVAAAGAAGFLVLGGCGAQGRRMVGWGLGTVGVLELSVYAQGLLVVAPASVFLGDDAVGRAILRSGMDRPGPVRLASFGSVYPDLRAAEAGLEKTNVNDGFQIRHAAALYERLYPLLDPSRPREAGRGPMDGVVDEYRGRVGQAVLDLMGVGYVVSDRRLPLPRIEPVETVGPVTVWRNPQALPPAYVVPRAIPNPTRLERRGNFFERFDPREAVVMDRDPLPAGDRQAFTPAEWVSHDPDEVVIRVETRAPGLLVVGNTWMPGWGAVVDGKAEAVEPGNHWQQVVAVRGAGRHEVVLRYNPPGLALGALLTAASVVVWAGAGLALAARSLRAPGWAWAGKPRTAPALAG